MKNNFDLKKFLVENKLTTNSRQLAEEAPEVIKGDFPWPEDLWDDVIGSKINWDEEGSGKEALKMFPNAKFIGAIPTDNFRGPEEYLFYYIGKGLVLVLEDYTGYGYIHRAADLDKVLPGHGFDSM